MAYVGVHSDIGGGYKSGDLSDLSLLWIMKHFNKTRDGNYLGISDSYKKISNPIVHDSVGVYPLSQYNPSRQFLWATDGKGISQFESIAHLKLNWKDTELFQNPNNQKFTYIRNRYADLIAKDKSPAKGSDMTDGGVLMAANKENKIIAINDYLYWLKCHYGIDLKYTNKEIKSSETALSDKQLCSGIPLHKQVKK